MTPPMDAMMTKDPTLPSYTGRFRLGDLLVYPSRGVFTVTAIKTLHVDNNDILSLILYADDARSTLAIPITKAEQGVVRPLTSGSQMQRALNILSDYRRRSRVIWARRAQDYEAKIKTGDPIRLAEVLRDLYRASGQSFSERSVFDSALERLSAELAAVMQTDRDTARDNITALLAARDAATKEFP